MPTIEDIRAMLSSGDVSPTMNDAVMSGTLVAHDGTQHTYTVHCGWDIAKCFACDDLWHEHNIKLMQWIKAQNFDAEKLEKVLADIQIDDSHWEWFKKSVHFKSDEYRWFFIMVDNVPQAACVLYHPKKSALADMNVFYIEYIAVAPWNRENPMEPRKFKGLGSLLIKAVINFCVGKFAFNHGFSLHALPRAVDFYQKIGMQHIEAHDKGVLQFFEMPNDVAIAYAGA